MFGHYLIVKLEKRRMYRFRLEMNLIYFVHQLERIVFVDVVVGLHFVK
jgi:hypothetical protein